MPQPPQRGLKVGLRAVFLAPPRSALPRRWRRPDRQLTAPLAIKQLLMEGRFRCPADQPIFANPAARQAVCARWIQILIREAAKRAGLPHILLPVTLRHSYAVHLLQDGGTIRQWQDSLDHLLLETTARYLAITGLSKANPPEIPERSTPVSPAFWQKITDRLTRKIKGTVLFKDIAGDLIQGVRLSYDDGVAARDTVVWHGNMDYNQFDDDDKKPRSTNRD